MIRTRLQGDTPFFPNMLNNGKVEVCLKEDVDNTLAEKDKEIAELKAEINRKEAVGQRWFERCMEARTENIRLKEERHWRKFSEGKPERHQWILVFNPNHSQFTTGIELRRWDDGCKFDVEFQEIYEKWMPLPATTKEAK